MPIRVSLPGRGVLTFDDGTSQADIEATIQRDFPRTGEEVAADLAQDPNAHHSISDEDFSRYKEYLDQRKTDIWETAANAAGAIGTTISNGLLGLFEARNLNPEVAIGTGIEATAQGTRQLYGMLAQSEDPNSVLFRFKDWINGTGDIASQKRQWQEAREFAKRSQELEEGKDTVTSIPTEYVNNDVKNALSLVADPTMLIPGVGEALGASRLASKIVGAGTKALAEGARTITRPLAGAIDAAAEAATKATGSNAAALKATAAATGTTGLVMGVPGIREAAATVAGVKVADKVAEILARAGENLAEGGSRIGPMEAVGRAPNAGKIDKIVGTVGRLGGDTALDIGLASATGALEGASIGAGLGYLSGGEEGAAAGLGSGAVLGGTAAGAMRSIDTARGKVAAENRANDLRRYMEKADPEVRAQFGEMLKRDGLDAAANTMDVANLLRGHLEDAKFTILDDKAFQDRFGADARGVQVITAGQPEVVINSSKMRSNYTAGHELFHAFDATEQLRPQAERIKQEIVGTFVTQPDGKVVQATQGLLSPAELDVAFKQYQRKLAKSGIAGKEWFTASTPAEKARLVSSELGSEYMARLISGSGPDEILRGFAGPVRTLLDMALAKDAGSRLRQIAEKLGTGTRPIESMVFRGLKEASPALNGMLRDLVRARRNLSERMELADNKGIIITPRDISVPVVADKAVAMGVAERRPDGTVAMKPDDTLAREDRAASDAIRAAVETTPIADPTQPHMRVVDDTVVGGGISPEQVAAINSSPAIPNHLKKALTEVSGSLAASGRAGDPNVLWIEYGAATRRVKNRLTGSYTSKYSSGIRLSQREIAPYALLLNKGDVPYARAVDVTKLRRHAQDLAANGKLGAYGSDIGGFLADTVRYFENISDPAGVRTHELPGMTPEKAAFLNSTFGESEKGGAKFIRSIRLDRITEIRPTGERIAASELAWQRQKVNWMPAEKMPDGEVISSPQGFRVIKKNGKYSLYGQGAEPIGIYDTQAKAEAKAEREYNSSRSLAAIKRTLPTEDRLAVVEAEKKIAQTSKEYPEAVRLTVQRDEKGMPKIDLLEDADGNPILDENGKQKRGVVFEKVQYELRNAPGLSANDAKAVIQGADLLEKSAKEALRSPSIRKGLGWYARMRDFFQRELGASIEAFGQLLGATSARTPVDTNFRQALEALRLFSSGKYDDLVQRYHEHVTRVKSDAASGALLERWKQANPTKRESQFVLGDEIRKRINDFEDVPLRSNGAKYNANSMKVLQVLYGNWVDQTVGPKTPNFAGNLTGRTLAATIDVWAARNLRRLLYEGQRKQWRILPEQESGVKFTVDKNGNYGGDFVFAQKIYDEVGRRMNISPDDLQALMWFAEKDVWDRNGWTNKAGGEKSSFDKEAGLLNLRRYQAGITTFTDEKNYSVERQRKAANELRDTINSLRVDRYGQNKPEPGAVVARVNHTEGLYGDVIEPSLDVEFSLQRKTNPLPVLHKLVEIAARPENRQTDVFLSKVVDQDHPNARPGMEIGFKKPASQDDIKAVMKVFRDNGIDGFTVAKDANGKILGIRTQYVPEISGRYDASHLDPQSYPQRAGAWAANARTARAALNSDNISYAKEAHFSTHVVGHEEYGKLPGQDLFGSNVRDELGRRQRAITQRSGEILRGDGAGQPSVGSGSGDAGGNVSRQAEPPVSGNFMPDAPARFERMLPAESDPIWQAALNQYASKGAGFISEAGKTTHMMRQIRPNMGQKLWENMTQAERIAEFRQKAIEDLNVAAKEAKDPTDYFLDRALDPLDPMGGLYKALLQRAGAELNGRSIRVPDAVRKNLNGGEVINLMPDTPEPRQQLDGTKVVDKEGKPLRVYHGSPEAGLSELKAKDGAIFFTDSEKVASGYTARRGPWMSRQTGQVVPAFINIKNPLEIDALGKRADNIPVPWQEWKPKVYGNLPANAVSVEAAARRAKEQGHDGLIVRNVIDTADGQDRRKSTVYAVFDPAQVSKVNFMPDASARSLARMDHMLPTESNPAWEAALRKYGIQGAGYDTQLGKTVGMHRSLRERLGLKLWENMTHAERIAEFRQKAIEDLNVASTESERWVDIADYMLDRSLDPIDPMAGLYKEILRNSGAKVKGNAIEITPEARQRLVGGNRAGQIIAANGSLEKTYPDRPKSKLYVKSARWDPTVLNGRGSWRVTLVKKGKTLVDEGGSTFAQSGTNPDFAAAHALLTDAALDGGKGMDWLNAASRIPKADRDKFQLHGNAIEDVGSKPMVGLMPERKQINFMPDATGIELSAEPALLAKVRESKLKPNTLYVWGNDWNNRHTPEPTSRQISLKGRDPADVMRSQDLTTHLAVTTDSTGRPHKVISPNGKVSDYGTPEGNYTMGDVHAFERDRINKIEAAKKAGRFEEAEKLVAEKVAELQGKIDQANRNVEKQIAEANDAKAQLDRGVPLSKLDFRLTDDARTRKYYLDSFQGRVDYFQQTAKDFQAEMAKWNSLAPRKVNLMPEAMPNGTVYKSDFGFSVVNKDGGKFRIYSPLGHLIGVAKSLEEAQRIIRKHQ